LKSGARVSITLRAGGFSENISARGHPDLTLNDEKDMVARKSSFICGRTLAIMADKAAKDFSKGFVRALREPANVIEMEIRVSP
jgi:hypothetical protein